MTAAPSAPSRKWQRPDRETRNSFVVLPLALALAPEWQTATVVIVFESLVELFGMIGFLWIVPQFLAPTRSPEADKGKAGRMQF